MDKIPQIQDESPQPAKNQSPALKALASKSVLSRLLPILIVIIIAAAGIASGLVLASRQKSSARPLSQGKTQDATQKIPETFAQTFKDQAEGVIQKNDKLDKYVQGTHKLIRPGGESQTAYLTSSVLDLDQYLGKKVKVFGETFGSSQVGWLMDVGKVEPI